MVLFCAICVGRHHHESVLYLSQILCVAFIFSLLSALHQRLDPFFCIWCASLVFVYLYSDMVSRVCWCSFKLAKEKRRTQEKATTKTAKSMKEIFFQQFLYNKERVLSYGCVCVYFTCKPCLSKKVSRKHCTMI